MPMSREALSVSVGNTEKPRAMLAAATPAADARTIPARSRALGFCGNVREKSQTASASFAMENAEIVVPSKYIRCSLRGSR